jgi:two-component system, NarL family, invasion response regulator UvrY
LALGESVQFRSDNQVSPIRTNPNPSFPKRVPSVLIVDENLLTRLGLQQILSEEYRSVTIGEAKNGDEAVIRLMRQPWDLVVLGLSILGKNGFYVLQEIRNRYPNTRVLVLSTHTDSQHSLRAQEWGASGYIGKNAARADFLRAFRKVFAGKRHFEDLPSSGTAGETATRHGGLSAREYGVMLGYVAGKRPTQMAADLGLSIKTISTYKRRILDKLGLDSIAELVRYAIDHRLS